MILGDQSYYALIGLFASVFVQVLLFSFAYKKKTVKGEATDTDKSLADQIFHVIKTRRSVKPKDFNDSDVTVEELNQVLLAGNWAPSHGKTEPWRFTVVRGDQAKREMVDLTCKVVHELGDSKKEEYIRTEMTTGKFKNVKAFIFIGMKRRALPDKEMPEWEELCAVATAAQNMMLQAHAAGLAGYWSSYFSEATTSVEFVRWLGLDYADGDRCLGALILGKADPDRLAGYRGSKRPIESKVTWK